ncbi:IS600 ORF2 [Shigella sonnei]|nr:IS600 ORF2 [Shigella sonnei]
MCQVFGVSRSGYYNWVQHEPSDRKQSDERLKLEIKVAHIRTRETYGTRRLQTELAENGIIVGRDRLARLRKELRLRCKQKRKFRATTNSNHNLPVAPNLLNQTFAPTAPNQVWVADLTYVATQEGWLYLAGIKDVYTCEIVGYAMGERMTKELKLEAMRQSYLNQAYEKINDWRTELQLGTISDEDRAALTQWMAYISQVKKMELPAIKTEAEFNAIKWPEQPQ